MNIIYPAFALFAFACFALSPTARAVTPAPDGGYFYQNTAEGQNALFSVDTSLYSSGVENTAIGFQALYSDVSGPGNTAIGASSLYNNQGTYNTATGDYALLSNISGDDNTANGALALNHSTGSGNTAIGFTALFGNTSGSNNIALGVNAGKNLTTGSGNICIGQNVFGVAGESNTTRIGHVSATATFIRGISGATAAGGAAVFVTSSGHLGTLPSSARFKDDIKPMGNASEAILALRPVSFRYKKDIDPQGIPEFGLVAEEVEKVNPELVTRDAKGEVETVRYEAVNAMLLNEFLKEHRKVEKLEGVVASLAATVKEQAAQIQKVSAQLEASKPAPQVVNNP